MSVAPNFVIWHELGDISRRIQGRAISLTFSFFIFVLLSRDRSRIAYDANTFAKRTYDSSLTCGIFCQFTFLRSASIYISFDVRINSFEMWDIISWLGMNRRETEAIKLRLRYGDRHLSQSFNHVRLSATKKDTTEMWINIETLAYFIYLFCFHRNFWEKLLYQIIISKYIASFVIIVTNIISWYTHLWNIKFFLPLKLCDFNYKTYVVLYVRRN